MNILTRYSGEVEIDDKQILHFEKGIPGFSEEKKFTILPLSEDHTLLILQSIETAELAFVIANPFNFIKDYDFTLDDVSVEQLKLETNEQVEVFTILTVQDPFQNTTANLQAPIIINKANRLAKQVILNHPAYTTRTRIFDPKPSSSKG